jgi:hypothetical protein
LRPAGDLLREEIARACPLALQRWTKKNPKVPQFLVLKILQTKYSLQSSEFLLTKDREIADNVHQGFRRFRRFCTIFSAFLECVLNFNVFSQNFRNLDVFRQNLDTF